jgi:hypothetical protein
MVKRYDLAVFRCPEYIGQYSSAEYQSQSCSTGVGSAKFRISFVYVLLFGSLAGLLAIADRAPLHLDKRHPEVHVESDFYRYYNGVVDGSLPGPYAYRFLVPRIIWVLHIAVPSASELTIDFVSKLLILWAIQILFFHYAGRYLDFPGALGAVLWLDVLTGFSLAYVQGPSTAETMDLFNLLVCLLFLLWVEKGTLLKLGVLVGLGILNRETPLLLLPLILILDVWNKRGLTRTTVLGIIGVTTYMVVRMLITPAAGGWVTTEGLPYNLPGADSATTERALVGFIHVVILIGPLLGLASMRFKEKPILLRSAILVAPIFILVHYVVGTAIESRLWFPLYIFLIPPALLTLRALTEPHTPAPD